jgi:hypothetical protein
MKTGKFLKFTRPAGEVHAYLYLEDGRFKAAIYVPGRTGQAPEHTIDGDTEAGVEQALRAWVDSRYPRRS